MKKKVPAIVASIVLFAAIVFLSSYYIIIPSTRKITELDNSIVKPEDKTALIAEINEKYANLENEIETKNANREKELKNNLIEKQALEQKEFRQNGFSKEYYTLSSEIRDIQSELAKIKMDRTTQKFDLNVQKEKEIRQVNSMNNDTNNAKKVGYILFIVLGGFIIVLPLLYLWSSFNSITKLYNIVKARWSEVDVYLKQRADLIPNIVESVKGYSKHEKDTLTDVISARSKVASATSKEEEISANEDLSKAVKQIFALSEDYPELKADQNFMNLQNNLRVIEDKISRARTDYNYAVLRYKNKIGVFPSNIVAGIFSFKPELFFEIKEEEKENPKIKFN